MMFKKVLLGVAFAALSFQAVADSPAIAGVEVKKRSSGRYTFKVTVKHRDEGWKHYVDRWEIALTDGTVLARRILPHPHEREPTFTRSLHGVEIPPGISRVLVRAHDVLHGMGDKVMEVELPR